MKVLIFFAFVLQGVLCAWIPIKLKSHFQEQIPVSTETPSYIYRKPYYNHDQYGNAPYIFPNYNDQEKQAVLLKEDETNFIPKIDIKPLAISEVVDTGDSHFKAFAEALEGTEIHLDDPVPRYDFGRSILSAYISVIEYPVPLLEAEKSEQNHLDAYVSLHGPTFHGYSLREDHPQNNKIPQTQVRSNGQLSKDDNLEQIKGAK